MTGPAGLFWRVLITGSRDWHDREALSCSLAGQAVAARRADVYMIVVHGGARGADQMAAEWARLVAGPPKGWPVRDEPHPVDGAAWRVEGLRAGHNRNQRMVDAGADVCLAFFVPCAKAGCRKYGGTPHESHGAADCAARALSAGIPVIPHLSGGVALRGSYEPKRS